MSPDERDNPFRDEARTSEDEAPDEEGVALDEDVPMALHIVTAPGAARFMIIGGAATATVTIRHDAEETETRSDVLAWRELAEGARGAFVGTAEASAAANDDGTVSFCLTLEDGASVKIDALYARSHAALTAAAESVRAAAGRDEPPPEHSATLQLEADAIVAIVLTLPCDTADEGLWRSLSEGDAGAGWSGGHDDVMLAPTLYTSSLRIDDFRRVTARLASRAGAASVSFPVSAAAMAFDRCAALAGELRTDLAAL
jgi:hypothetical protein